MADDIKKEKSNPISGEQEENPLLEEALNTCLRDWQRGGSISLRIAGENLPLSEIVYRIRKRPLDMTTQQNDALRKTEEELRNLKTLTQEELIAIWRTYLMPENLSLEQQKQWIKSMVLSMHQGSALFAFVSVFFSDLFSTDVIPVEDQGTRKVVLSMDKDKGAVICKGSTTITQLMEKEFPEKPSSIDPLQLQVTYALQPDVAGYYKTSISEFKLSLGNKDLSSIDQEAIKKLQETFLLCCKPEGALPKAASSAILHIF